MSDDTHSSCQHPSKQPALLNAVMLLAAGLSCVHATVTPVEPHASIGTPFDTIQVDEDRSIAFIKTDVLQANVHVCKSYVTMKNCKCRAHFTKIIDRYFLAS